MVAGFDPRDHLTVAIEGTFDVAIARNRLRQLADRFDLPTVLRARAAAAITTACETALFKVQNTRARVDLTITIVKEKTRQGVKLEFHAPFRSQIAVQNAGADVQLQRACDNLQIQQDGDLDLITMSIWARDKEQ
jgi:hypothetical protein